MAQYLAGRLASGLGVMIALVVIVFVATNVIGDPISLQRNPDFFNDEQIAEMRTQFGYDRPLWTQFVDYVGGVVRGDFGVSAASGRPASDVVLDRLPATALLAGAAIAITLVLAVPLALLAARSGRGRVDLAVTTGATALASLPSFWFAIALIFIFSVGLGWLPSGGYGSPRELVLPALALAALPLGHTTLVLASALRHEYTQPYVAVARAKGLGEVAIASRHVLRNAMLVLATQVGLLVIGLMNGAVLVEAVFAWPGLGHLGLTAVQGRDLPVVMATVVYVGLLVTAVNLVVDLGYARLDPRVRLS